MIEGRPYSVRSQKGKNKVRRIVEGSIDKIKEIIPSPVAFPVVMRIYVFTTEDTILPDVDRFSTPIMDTFNGIVYRDDNQISELHPRVINIKPALEVLECKTHPMALLELDRLPVGVLYPLSKTVQEYFVVDVRYSPLYLL
jgi:Holliday junction resolvase RusA-like endonuclease